MGWALIALPFVVMAIWGLIEDWRGVAYVAAVLLAIGVPMFAGGFLLTETGAL